MASNEATRRDALARAIEWAKTFNASSPDKITTADDVVDAATKFDAFLVGE